MSGDSTGALLGGALLLGMLPVIAGTAAAAGVAYGAVKAGQWAYRSYKRHQMEVSAQASAPVREAVRAINVSLEQRAQADSQLRQAHAQSVQACADSLRQMAAAPQVDEAAIRAKREELEKRMAADSLRKECAGLRRKAERDVAAALAASGKAAKAREALIAWTARDEESLSRQRRFVEEALADAREALAALRGMDDGGSAALEESSRALDGQLRQAEQALARGEYQLAAAMAQAAAMDSLSLAARHMQEQMDVEGLRTDLLARIEGLTGELQQRRIFTFHDSCAGCDERADLSDYSQGLWASAGEALRSARESVLTADKAGLEALWQDFSEELEPSVRRMMEDAQAQMLLYYQKLYAAENVIYTMQENNLTCVDVVQPQDDKTQELALLFADPFGTKLVVTLDADMASAAARMKLELHVPEGGRQPTEQELDAVRRHLQQGMQACTLGAQLSCCGNVGSATAHPEYSDLSRLREKPAQARVCP